MYLLDQVAQATARKIIRDPELGDLSVPSAPDIRDAVAAAEARYVLQDDVVAFVHDLVLEDSTLLASSLDLIRLPASTTWIEWREPPDTGEEGGARTGALVCADDDGRRGYCQLVWENSDQEPELSAARLCFDLDCWPRADINRGCFGFLHQDNEVNKILQHLTAEFHPGWVAYLNRSGTCERGNPWIKNALNSTWLAGPFILGFGLLLLVGSPLDFAEAKRDALNAKRLKRGRAPLLNHTVVSSSVFPQPVGHASHPGGSRRSARLHHVRGHLVRRGGAIFWRRPHLRGAGVVGPAYAPIRRLSL